MLRSIHRFVCLYPLIWLLACAASAENIDKTSDAPLPLLQPFSSMTVITDGWEPLTFPNIDRPTDYRLVQNNNEQVIMVSTDNSASGLIARLSVEPGDSLILRWRWKISSVYENGDARIKSGDDYPARIYVMFEFEADKAGFFERAKRKAAELIFGEKLPGNTLNYIWANKLSRGSMLANPYTDTAMMVAVESGNENAGQWVYEQRDIVADYRNAFGTQPPAVVGVAIMSDSDNIGASAKAWYGDVSLTRE